MLSREEVDMSHNDVFIDPIMEHLNNDKSVIFTEGTGIGKSYVGHQIIDKHFNDVPVLIIAPSNALLEQWKENIEDKDNIDFWTYQKLRPAFKKRMFKQYRLIIYDETHHVPAPSWGMYSFALAKAVGAKVIAMTATPLRRDNLDSINYFDEHVKGITTPEAIERGILAPYIYISCYYEIVENAKKMIGRAEHECKYISDELRGKFDLVQNTPPMDQILRDNMPPGQRKILVFYDTKGDHSFAEAHKVMKKAYPKAKEWVVSYKYTKKQNQEIVKSFEEAKDEICILYSINIFNEGLHVDVVNTVVMFRRTSSFRIFEQESGRLLSIRTADEKDHILFDFVGNAAHVNQNDAFKFAKNDKGKVRKTTSIVASIYKDYTKDCLEVIEEVYEKIYGNAEIIEFCESNNITKSAFDGIVKRHHFSKEDAMRYILGEIPSPNGKFYRKLRRFSDIELSIISDLAEKYNITENTIKNTIAINNFSVDDVVMYYAGKLPNLQGKYIKKGKEYSNSELKIISKVAKTYGVKENNVKAQMRNNGFSAEEVELYFAGKIKNKKGKFHIHFLKKYEKSEIIIFEEVAEKHDIGLATVKKHAKIYNFTAEEIKKYYDGEIPNPSGSYYKAPPKRIKNKKEFERIAKLLGKNVVSVIKMAIKYNFSPEQVLKYYNGEITNNRGLYYGQLETSKGCPRRVYTAEENEIISKIAAKYNTTKTCIKTTMSRYNFGLEEVCAYFAGKLTTPYGTYRRNCSK